MVEPLRDPAFLFRHRGRQVLPRHAWVFAEFETNLRKERQLEGIAKAKAAGVYKAASMNATQMRAMKAEGMGATEIATALKIGRASVYRALEGYG